VPIFLTLGFQIFAGIHAGALAGFFICFRSPVKICTFFVPRSLSRISVMPLLAAFNAACLGDLPVKTPWAPLLDVFCYRLRKFSDGLIAAIFFARRYDTRSEITMERPKYSATTPNGRANGIAIIVGVLSRPVGVT
jgi:hypothetical protein